MLIYCHDFYHIPQNGTRETYSNRYDEDDEQERDAAWDDIYATFPRC